MDQQKLLAKPCPASSGAPDEHRQTRLVSGLHFGAISGFWAG